jgi:8-oxo-dGTP diphosphatase
MATSTSTAPIAADLAPDQLSLSTERLVLRPYEAADARNLQRLINDWAIIRNLAGVPYPYEREIADDWIQASRHQLATATGWHFALTERESGALIGGVGLRPDPQSRSASLGYWIGRKSWGQGYATEAARRLAHWALAHLDLDRITATIAADNPASMAVLRHLGFRENGLAGEHFLARGAECPVVRFIATRDDLFGIAYTAPDPTPAPAASRILLVAACALIDADGRVLLARRPEGKKLAGLWEFPGGKLDPGETPEAALIRELREELGIDVSAACLAPFAFASHAYETFHLLMPLFLCRRWSGTPRGAEGQELAWVRPQKLAEYAMPPADRPLIPLLRDFL